MSRRVLIVDDEPNIVTSLEFLMRGDDYEVLVARNGEEALQLAESFRPDIVVLDVMMPQRSGFEVCESIRTLWRWLMESNGIAVKTFATAAAFIESYRSGDAGCLVLDLKLPGMSGLELQQYLTRNDIEIPIVFVTGYGDVPAAVSALKGGAVDFIQKPFSHREVLS